MSTPTVVLITGANRGIGRGLLEIYLNRPNHIVIGTVRDTLKFGKESSSLPRHETSRLIITELEVSDFEAHKVMIQKLVEEHPEVTHLNLVIANAGILELPPSKPSTADPAVIQKTLNVNTFGPLALWQATIPLLEKAEEGQGKFVAITSSVASFALGYWQHSFEYAISKVALNMAVFKMHQENERIISFPICPGGVLTDMGNAGMKGLENYDIVANALTVEQSTTAIVKVIDAATRETHSGKFWSQNGSEVPF